MADWYRDHHVSPEAAGEDEYLDWAQSAGAYVDAAGNATWPDQPGHPDNIRSDVNPVCGHHVRSRCDRCGTCTSCDGCYCEED